METYNGIHSDSMGDCTKYENEKSILKSIIQHSSKNGYEWDSNCQEEWKNGFNEKEITKTAWAIRRKCFFRWLEKEGYQEDKKLRKKEFTK